MKLNPKTLIENVEDIMALKYMIWKLEERYMKERKDGTIINLQNKRKRKIRKWNKIK